MAECALTELPVEMCAHCRGDRLPGEADDSADPDYGPPFIAQYDGHCDGCGSFFAAGDTIRSDGQMGWLCESCGAA